jgi:hypothetical protein
MFIFIDQQMIPFRRVEMEKLHRHWNAVIIAPHDENSGALICCYGNGCSFFSRKETHRGCAAFVKPLQPMGL